MSPTDLSDICFTNVDIWAFKRTDLYRIELFIQYAQVEWLNMQTRHYSHNITTIVVVITNPIIIIIIDSYIRGYKLDIDQLGDQSTFLFE